MSQISRALVVLTLAAAAAGAPGLGNAQTPQKPPGTSTEAMQAKAEHMAAMDSQMKAMREMHDKMVNAKTPEQRNALMAEHMKTLQAGMATMNMMGGAGTGGMGGMGAMGAKNGGKPMPGDMDQRQQMMDKRMDMMQSMLQMMVDRMPAAPAK